MTGTGVQPYDDEGRLLCLECGQPFQLLAPHLARAHGMDTTVYRERHQLPRTLSLRAAALTDRARVQGRDRYQARPDIRANLKAGRRNAPDNSAVASSQETAMRPMVRHARRRGGQGKMEAELRRRTEAVRAAGFVDLGAYLADREGATVSAMARELGLSRMALSRWIQQSRQPRA